MKKSLLLVLISFLSLASCKKSDESIIKKNFKELHPKAKILHLRTGAFVLDCDKMNFMLRYLKQVMDKSIGELRPSEELEFMVHGEEYANIIVESTKKVKEPIATANNQMVAIEYEQDGKVEGFTACLNEDLSFKDRRYTYYGAEYYSSAIEASSIIINEENASKEGEELLNFIFKDKRLEKQISDKSRELILAPKNIQK